MASQAAAECPQACYVREGEGYCATGLVTSPWDTRMQPGSLLAGLAAHLLHAVPTPVPMTPVRLTVDIHGAVPTIPLVPTIRLLREGKRIQSAELTLEGEGRTRLRATLLRVRETREGRAPDGVDAPQDGMPVPPTRSFPEKTHRIQHGRMSDMIRLSGNAEEAGPGAMWVRIGVPVVAGEETSALARVAMAADFGSTIAPPAARSQWTFASIDLSVHLARLPVTDWLLIDATSQVGHNGAGMVHMHMGDRTGMFGMAHMALYVEPRT